MLLAAEIYRNPGINNPIACCRSGFPEERRSLWRAGVMAGGYDEQEDEMDSDAGVGAVTGLERDAGKRRSRSAVATSANSESPGDDITSNLPERLC